MNAIKEISTFSLSNPVPHSLDNTLPEKNPRNGIIPVLKDETS